MNRLLPRSGLAIARFCLSAWIGAAVLFVVIGVREVRHPQFDSVIKNQLALIRFPPYYLCGSLLLGAAAIGLLSALYRLSHRIRLGLALLLVIGSAVIMAYDYLTIYSPIVTILQASEAARPSEFISLHERSKQINMLHVGLACLAALLCCWESKVPKSPEVTQVS